VTNIAILTFAGLLLVAYAVEVFGRRLRLPSVGLLIGTGIALRFGLDAHGVQLDWVDPVVPIIGTFGLILIVLEGALDLELRRDRARLIAVSGAAALVGFVVCAALFTLLLQRYLGLDAYRAALAALPFAVISSAIAIPSAAGLPPRPREFVVYESSVSDILGVLVFYAWLESGGAIDLFELDILQTLAGSVAAAAVAALGLYALLNRLRGHVRFVPLLASIAFIYAAGKAVHLSPLIVVLAAGLILNNPRLLHRVPVLARLHTPAYDDTLREFKGLVAELTFATKSLFFVLLGYWTDLSHMADPRAWVIAGAMLAVIYASRFALLVALRLPSVEQLVWVAPRGLITVLLFLAATESADLRTFPFGAVMLVVLATSALVVQARGEGASSAEAEPTGRSTGGG
jgi:hypothetical protein